MTVYRMHRAARAASDYTGALLAGGRWNPIGTPVLYAAEHLSLACLEVLVHLDKGQLPRNYVWSSAELSGVPEVLNIGDLRSVRSCQADGGRWLRDGRQLAVRVPSVVIAQEYNILLNPAHPLYGSMVWSLPQPFYFDPRLFVAEPGVL